MSVVGTKTIEWNAADYLESAEDVVAYLEAAFEDGDPGVITAAIEDIARSTAMPVASDSVGIDQRTGLVLPTHRSEPL